MHFLFFAIGGSVLFSAVRQRTVRLNGFFDERTVETIVIVINKGEKFAICRIAKCSKMIKNKKKNNYF